MKAITLQENGGIENLVMQEIPVPEIGPDEVLINVKSISINPVDAYVRQSPDGLKIFLKPGDGEKILILGWDVAGTIQNVGRKVTKFSIGDEVFGLINFAGHGKAYAEFVAAPENQLAHKPSNVSFSEAAGATLAALTAWQALVIHAGVIPNEKVIVHAAAGGVGHYAVQIAKSLGAYVIAVASPTNHNFVKALGADEVLDYSQIGRASDSLVDVVVDSLAEESILNSIRLLKPGGRLISLLTFVQGKLEDEAKKKNIIAKRMTVRSDGDDMAAIASLMKDGKLTSHISKVFEFHELPQAHQQIESRKTKGKIVINLQ